MGTNPTQKRFSEEFKVKAVRQITEHDHKVADGAARALEDQRLVELIRQSWVVSSPAMIGATF